MFHFYFNLLQSDYDYENNYYFQNFKDILLKKNIKEMQRIHDIIYESKIHNYSDEPEKQIKILKKKKSFSKKKKVNKRIRVIKSLNNSKKNTPSKSFNKSSSVPIKKGKKISKQKKNQQ